MTGIGIPFSIGKILKKWVRKLLSPLPEQKSSHLHYPILKMLLLLLFLAVPTPDIKHRNRKQAPITLRPCTLLEAELSLRAGEASMTVWPNYPQTSSITRLLLESARLTKKMCVVES